MILMVPTIPVVGERLRKLRRRRPHLRLARLHWISSNDLSTVTPVKKDVSPCSTLRRVTAELKEMEKCDWRIWVACRPGLFEKVDTANHAVTPKNAVVAMTSASLTLPNDLLAGMRGVSPKVVQSSEVLRKARLSAGIALTM